MKRLFFITSIIVLSCVLASGFIIPITSEANTSAKSLNSESISGEEYIIKAKGDRIVVYKDNADKPYLETTTAVSSLPADIQKKLNRGISYSSEESMQKALDEFCS
ncbi:MAG: hypothetical protein Q4B92_03700 [Ruminococcus sp.]|nr:hypothetical protein [Ruminococcus sp.]